MSGLHAKEMNENESCHSTDKTSVNWLSCINLWMLLISIFTFKKQWHTHTHIKHSFRLCVRLYEHFFLFLFRSICEIPTCIWHMKFSSSHGKVYFLWMDQSWCGFYDLLIKEITKTLDYKQKNQFLWLSTQAFPQTNTAPLCSTLIMTSAVHPIHKIYISIKNILRELCTTYYTYTHTHTSASFFVQFYTPPTLFDVVSSDRAGFVVIFWIYNKNGVKHDTNRLSCIRWQRVVRPCTLHLSCCGCIPTFSSTLFASQVSNWKLTIESEIR